MTDPGPTLARFLLRARSVGRRRLGSVFLADIALLLATEVSVGAALAGWLLRGDLVAPLVIGAGLGILAGAIWRFVRQRTMAYGRRSRWEVPTARTIARTRGTLRTSGADLTTDAALRQEILGATELRGALLDSRPTMALHSSSLATRYVEDVAARLLRIRADPDLAVPPVDWRPRLVATGSLFAALVLASTWPGLGQGYDLLLHAADGRPAPPREPVWSSLSLEITYPAHTGRPPRSIPNPSGALRLPAGTEIAIDMHGRQSAGAARLVVTYDADELEHAPPPQVVELHGDDGSHWTGGFVLRGSGSWTIVLLDSEDDEVATASRRSAALPLQLEPDRPPDIELFPLSRLEQQASETDKIDIRFHARDDFGLLRAELVYQMPDGTAYRTDLGAPPSGDRSWRHRHTWDLSSIPIDQRTEVLFWVEARDNDPGLGLEPLPDPPGKITRSAALKLLVQDEEAEHAANIDALRDARDAAIDLLGSRMLMQVRSPAAGDEDEHHRTVERVQSRVAAERDVLEQSERLVAGLANIVDALSMDTMVRERDVDALTAIHGRLGKLLRRSLQIHQRLPPRIESAQPETVPAVLADLGRHNVGWITQLEDEVIRLDDLVDEQIIERIEALLARLRTTQQKLVQLLEQLQAGDESVAPQIDQLEQRRRDDLRRLAEARAMLGKELGQEFMNLDALDLLRRQMEEQQATSAEQRLEQARSQLGEIEQLHRSVQDRLATADGDARLSEEELERMRLLRELSRLQDEESTLRSETRRLHNQWRQAVSDREVPEAVRKEIAHETRRLREALDAINDARLGRDARRGIEDAKAALDRLANTSEQQPSRLLGAAEAAKAAAAGMQSAAAGSEPSESEGQRIRRLREGVEAIERKLSTLLPHAGQVLDDDASGRMADAQRRQQALRERTRDLVESSLADPLPGEGRTAIRRALQGMDESSRGLGRRTTSPALDGQDRAWEGIQRAIDSLRRASPPPSAAAKGEASTEAERDRSLRDQLLDAMREGAPEGFQDSVKRYYEELLR